MEARRKSSKTRTNTGKKCEFSSGIPPPAFLFSLSLHPHSSNTTAGRAASPDGTGAPGRGLLSTDGRRDDPKHTPTGRIHTLTHTHTRGDSLSLPHGTGRVKIQCSQIAPGFQLKLRQKQPESSFHLWKSTRTRPLGGP